MRAFEREMFDTRIMGGQACIRGMRITAPLSVRLVAQDQNPDAILAEYPDLEPEDIHQALRYAAWLASDQVHVERAA